MNSDQRAPVSIVPGHRPIWRIRALITSVIMAGVLGSVLSGIALVTYMNYERTHDLPNPIWGVYTRDYTYTPATAALNPDLLRTRPDLVFLRYVDDYIQLAGTYPCARDLANYGNLSDPILAQQTRTCPFRRPVANVVVTRVYVGVVGSEGLMPGAVVTYTVTYADGTYWSGQDILGANQSQQYYLSHIHLTCWDSLGITALYSYVLPLSHVPRGVEYAGFTPEGERAYRCKP